METTLPPIKKTLTEEELNEIAIFRKSPKVNQYLKSHHLDFDFYVNRWLTVSKRNVDKAIDMFVASIKWRNEVGADKIIETFPKNEFYPKLIEYWPVSQITKLLQTTDGSPVILEALGRCDPEVLDVVGIDNFIKFHIYRMELLQQIYFKIISENGYFPGFVVIQDLTGWKLAIHSVDKAIQAFNKISTINKNNYPDTLRMIFILNSPSIVTSAWIQIKSWFDPRSLSKFYFENGGEETFRNLFTPFIPVNELPKRLGGNSTEDISLGGEINKKSTSGYLKIKIGKSNIIEFNVEVNKGDIVEWKFKTMNHSIIFGVRFEGKNKKNTEIISPTRAESHKSSLYGKLTANNDGLYHFLWDNTFSWATSKTILYRITKNSVPVNMKKNIV